MTKETKKQYEWLLERVTTLFETSQEIYFDAKEENECADAEWVDDAISELHRKLTDIVVNNDDDPEF